MTTTGAPAPPVARRRPPAGVVRRVDLPGGRQLVVRRERPTDVSGLIALYDRMPEDELYCRFFTSHRPPDSFMERMARVHERGGAGLVAVLDGGGGHRLIVGECSYELLDDGNGELGIAVGADMRGWLGPYLLGCLRELAAERGVPGLEAEVLLSNHRMLAVLRAVGYVVLERFDSPATLRVLVATAGTAPAWPAGHDRPRLLVEIPGGIWHLAGAMAERGFQVVGCPGPDRGGPACGPRTGRPCPLAAAADVIIEAQTGELGEVLRRSHPALHPGAVTSRAGAPPFPAGDDGEIGDFLEDLAGRAGRDVGP